MDFYDGSDEQINVLLKKVREEYKSKKIKREAYYANIWGVEGRHIVFYWTGLNPVFNVWENVKIYTGRALDLCKSYGIKTATVVMNTRDGVPFIGKAVEGALLGSYSFDKYKKERDNFYNDFIFRIVSNERVRRESSEAAKEFELIGTVTNECRDIINEPGSVVYPWVLAEMAKEIGRQYGMKVTIWDQKALEREKYNGLLQVGKGSIHSPCLIMLEYLGGRQGKLGLIGKGITFDSGGISLKPGAGMQEMKGDMAGGAVVLYAMKAIAALGVPCKVTGIIPAAENLPDANAQRPGDIFYAKNGKTIMVDNTDAEGRLILTDALYLAGEQKCTDIVDIATLTGSCLRALGTSIAGIMGNDRNLIEAVINAGKQHGELYWELPMIEEYKEMLKSTVADINNVGGVNAGAITAALFLREFVPEDTPWAHLDIAGPFMQEKPWKYYGAGATAFGIKTFIELARHFDKYIEEKQKNDKAKQRRGTLPGKAKKKKRRE
ncbi:MAG: hypothetical protein A2Y62_05265 [Candidatus Fischerbacteria bacterium RBG_13_37_8]|uniref:Probable cytosol aminopeptidase n=1 Tax=Candidatus Fischerbacteria bacterium RBG_13_37_8 TaxID=1817863 RepID=A0A1F5VXK3_9BACT|nr:MAG: hypothetical protein A2Y62_05265 [Candidatus Fischerbacteria bacterium RBG_13_37_8]